ncbi:murein biosynthesis integral membrane protein MurJ [Streptococcus pluranimalium]
MKSESKSNRRTAFQLILMIVITVLSQVLALYKSRYTAVNFGATNYMDAYNFSLSIATFIFTFVVGGVTTVIIPAYVKKISSRAIDTFITVTFGCVLLLTLFLILVRTPLIALLTGREGNFLVLASDFLIISFIIQGVTAFLAVTSAYYQCTDRYNIPKMIVLLANLFVVVVLLSGFITNIYLYFFLLVLGSIINLLVDVTIAFKLGFRYRICFDLKSPEFKQMMSIFLPTLLSSGVYKLQSMVDTTIATNLPEGQTTILAYSTQIISMISTIVIGNLTVYVYPKIVATLKSEHIFRYFWDYCIFFHGILVLMIASFINVGSEGLTILFLGGEFTIENVKMLFICSSLFILGQQFNIVRDLIYRFFYANGNTQETFKNSIIVSVLNVLLSLILVIFFGIYGIILGTLVAGFVSLIMITFRFNKIFGLGVKLKVILIELTKNIVAMLGSIFLVQYIKGIFPIHSLMASITIYGLVTIVVFVFLVLIFKTRMRYIKL